MRDDVSLGDAVLIHDDTGNPKQGKHSVGVARQYCSQLGKVANCQVVVTCHYADPATSWPVNARLYLPSEWTDDPQRMREAGVPEDVQFQTKPEIASALLDEANRIGIKQMLHKAVVADASYGGNDTYLYGLEQRKEHYVSAVPCDFTVILGFFGISPRKGLFQGSNNHSIHRSGMNDGIYVGLLSPLFMRLLLHLHQKLTNVSLRKYTF